MSQNIAELIRENRRRRGWSQGELSAQLRVNQQTISRWESGKTKPSAQCLRQLSDLFGDAELTPNNNAAPVVTAPSLTLLPAIPFENLSPEDFESFCRDLLAKLYPDLVVSRFGSQGDT